MLFKVDTYAAPAVDVVEVGVERGFDMTGIIGDWEKGDNIEGDAE
jgi:hypothetical protein